MKGVGGKPGWVRLTIVLPLGSTDTSTGLDIHFGRLNHHCGWHRFVLDGP
jgi:hypothetical protein